MSDQLKKSINFFALTMIAAGSCIGSGIFIAPSDVANFLRDGWDIMIVWSLGGVVAMTGALTFAELGSRMPGTGGVYLYLRNAYGDLMGFLYGWCILTVITSGAIAGLCIVFAKYFCFVFGLGPDWNIPVSITELVIVTLINVYGVKLSTLFSSTLTVLKIAGIAGIVLAGCFAGQHFGVNMTIEAGARESSAFGLALIGVLWSYGGWHHASYVGGEVVNAQRILPRALIAGALIVTIVYLAANFAYLSLLPIDRIATSGALAADAIMQFTPAGAFLIAILIAISTFGTAGIFTLSAPRIYFRMGADGVFFPWLSDVHSKYGTPTKAILFQSFWAIILLLCWGTFEKISTYVVFMDWFFMTFAALGIFIFRRRKTTESHQGYKVPWYPVLPLIFIGISIWFLINTLIGRPVQAIAGLILLLIGFPVFLFFKRKKRLK